MSWLFPGREVVIEAACLDCGDPVVVRMRDGKIEAIDPPDAVGHANEVVADWGTRSWPFT